MDQVKNNPMAYSTMQLDALKEAFQLFVDAFKMYAEKENLSEEVKTAFLSMAQNAYNERRAYHVLSSQLKTMFHRFHVSLDVMMNENEPNEKLRNFKKLLYMNNTILHYERPT
jgi:hypothetical protein